MTRFFMVMGCDCLGVLTQPTEHEGWFAHVENLRYNKFTRADVRMSFSVNEWLELGASRS